MSRPFPYDSHTRHDRVIRYLRRRFLTMSRSSLVLFLLPLLALVLGACQENNAEGDGERHLVQSKGSETLVDVAQDWAEHYSQVNEHVAIAVSGGGSGSGISALIEGTVELAHASRRMLPNERRAARVRGVEPREFLVGYDALAVYLHPDNPLDSVSIPVLASIFGEEGDLRLWQSLGVAVPGCPSGEIHPLGRTNVSGTYAYFRQMILEEEGAYRTDVASVHDAAELARAVAEDPCAIGYGGLAFLQENVKAPCVMTEDPGFCVTASVETALDGSYPIARPLLIYSRGQPAPGIQGYLDWIRSDEGQCILQGHGYAPFRSSLDCPGGSVSG